MADAALAPDRMLLRQFLAWIGEAPRPYAEAMEGWRTSCPRLSIWEDALAEELVRIIPGGAGGMAAARVTLTAAGRMMLERPGSEARAG
ncbi:hypothetical protein GCM10011504_14840 [Siccirubricoccus deserti]|uniref:Uncharacterized protein n=1 Tax=Siccirubricoccus deserti TaxID=2013562 RepID=A0A9X0UCI8_9PROT|nr:hypothetical protein [Siccirubricoccus deserti]MBC4015282.1 hypothetical protein [Siccirubricoccus deserti]GGC37491.1 hypothetical protein GCM10011504_14840 [Siccirubricoccus deserti]